MAAQSWKIMGAALIGAGMMWAQQGSLAGPVTGIVFDRSARALRPVLGIPGASVFGDPMDLGLGVETAWVAPLQNAAVVAGTDGALHWFRMDAGKAAEVPFAVRIAVPEAVVFSPSGFTAALVRGDTVQIVKGLPGAPAAAGEVNLQTGRAARPVVRRLALAISDDGSYLLYGGGGAVRLLSASGENRRLLATGGPALVAFAPGTSDGVVVDTRGAGVVLFRDLTKAGNPETVVGSDERIASAEGVAFSDDGRKLFLSTASGRGVDILDLASGARNAVDCACAPSGLIRMGSVYRLDEPGAGPLWLLDPAAEPRIVFVPAMGTK
jgi:hypothetical protein